MTTPTAIVGCASRTALGGSRSIGKTTFVSIERFATTDDTPPAIASAVTRYGTIPAVRYTTNCAFVRPATGALYTKR